jgi:hypothetical protein
MGRVVKALGRGRWGALDGTVPRGWNRFTSQQRHTSSSLSIRKDVTNLMEFWGFGRDLEMSNEKLASVKDRGQTKRVALATKAVPKYVLGITALFPALDVHHRRTLPGAPTSSTDAVESRAHAAEALSALVRLFSHEQLCQHNFNVTYWIGNYPMC